jgi:hypothetical protein
MRVGIVAGMLAIVACADGGNAGAMNRAAEQQWCQVSGAGKLPAELGGADGLCAEIARALQPVSPKPAAVAVTVASPYLASASVTLADGQKLETIKVGNSDRPLNRRAIQMLAEGIATQVAARR